MSRGICRAAAMFGWLALVGCEKPIINLPQRPVEEPAPMVRLARIEQPVRPAPPPEPSAPLPVPPSPGAPSRMAPPTIRCHERVGQEGAKNRQRGMRFRIIYFQSPIGVATRVSIKDRFGLEKQIAARKESGLTGYAGIDEFVPNAARDHGPYLVKVEYLDPEDNSWNDAVGYEFLPKP